MFILYSEKTKFIIPSFSYQFMYKNNTVGIYIINTTIDRHRSLLMFSPAYGCKVIAQLCDESNKSKDKTDQKSII